MNPAAAAVVSLPLSLHYTINTTLLHLIQSDVYSLVKKLCGKLDETKCLPYFTPSLLTGTEQREKKKEKKNGKAAVNQI